MSIIWDISSRPTPRKGAFGTAHGALVSIALLSFAVLKAVARGELGGELVVFSF